MRVKEPKLKLVQKKRGKLLTAEYPFLPERLGLKEALILQQIHYWVSNPKNKNVREGRVWVYKTYKQWQTEFPTLSVRTIRRKIRRLESIGVLISNRFNRILSDRTKWYAIDHDKLNGLEIGKCGQNGQSMRPIWPVHVAKLATSNHRLPPKTTSEITGDYHYE